RLFLVDQQVDSIGGELRNDLGAWIRRRLSKGVEGQGRKAQELLESSGVEEAELRRQWALQKASELSVRAQAPVRLKKELDTVLALQSDLDACQKSLQTTRSTLAKTSASVTSVRILGNLQDHHDQLKEDIEVLYSSLTIQESYPELSGVDLEFVRALLVARDLKINVRKRAIGSFFEWDRLDQASGGREQVL
ncbi:hypothetical protein DXG01_015356, partial [Tephrocybe rancida]